MCIFISYIYEYIYICIFICSQIRSSVGLLGPLWALWAGPFFSPPWALVGRALLGPPGPGQPTPAWGGGGDMQFLGIACSSGGWSPACTNIYI